MKTETKSVLKNAGKYSLAALAIGLIAGIITGEYFLLTTSEEEIISMMGSINAFRAATIFQCVIYSVIPAFFGYILSQKVGLAKPLSFQKKPFAEVGISVIIAALIWLADILIFGKLDTWVGSCYASVKESGFTSVTLLEIMTGVFYGGFIEEFMIRLFLMSLLVFVLWKLFKRKVPKEEIPFWIFASANIISSLLFAAGHLPVTIQSAGSLTVTLVLRCFVCNSLLGVYFGRLYRKYGLQYAIAAHMSAHIVKGIILFLFVLL